MNPYPKIKVCGMRDANNISQTVALCPDYIGFIFYEESPRYITSYPEVNIPKSVKKVGVFVNALERDIQEAKVRFGLDMIQLHGDESPELCYILKQSGTQVMKVFRIDEDFNFDLTRRYEDYVDYFLFDTATKAFGGSGKKFNWELLKKYNQVRPIFLSGGIGPDDANKISQVKELNIYAIDVNSQFESEPGIKQVDKLSVFISEIRRNCVLHQGKNFFR